MTSRHVRRRRGRRRTVLAARARPAGRRSTAYAPMAENMPSGTAYRPGDVLTHVRRHHRRGAQHRRRGPPGARPTRSSARARTIPTTCSRPRPSPARRSWRSATRTPGVMGTDEFRDRVAAHRRAGRRGRLGHAAARRAAQRTSTRRSPTSPTSPRTAGGGMLVGRPRTCKEFVADGVQWAHIDIAGPAYNTSGPVRLHRQAAAPACPCAR